MAVKSKKTTFDFGKLAKSKGEQLSKIPMTRIFYLSILISVLTIVLTIFVRGSLPPEIPLFYGLPEGEERLAQPTLLLLPSAVSLFLTIVNTVIILNIKNELMQKSLVLASFALTIFSFVTTVKIILLVGSF